MVRAYYHLKKNKKVNDSLGGAGVRWVVGGGWWVMG